MNQAIVKKVLNHLMCQDIPKVYAKVGTWTFMTGIARYYNAYNELSINQINAIARMIYNHTGVICKHYKINRTTLYSREAPPVVVKRTRTRHNFKRLEPINTRDLPYKEGDRVQAICHPFNNSSIVLEHHNRFFKIPKPAHYVVAQVPTAIAFKYHETKCKGFIKF